MDTVSKQQKRFEIQLIPWAFERFPALGSRAWVFGHLSYYRNGNLYRWKCVCFWCVINYKQNCPTISMFVRLSRVFVVLKETGEMRAHFHFTWKFIAIFSFHWCMIFQKARLARIRIAKASSGAAFVSKKKAAEARLAAQESGIELDDTYREEDIFELQHHHLLRCLEKTTVIILLRFGHLDKIPFAFLVSLMWRIFFPFPNRIVSLSN